MEFVGKYCVVSESDSVWTVPFEGSTGIGLDAGLIRGSICQEVLIPS